MKKHTDQESKVFHYPNITAALDLSMMDEKIIKFSHFMAQHAAGESLRYVHIIPEFIFPGQVGSSFEELIRGEEPIERRIEHKLAAEVQPIADKAKGLDVQLVVMQGSPQERLLKHTEQHRPDLLILGKKALSGNSGIISRRIARKTNCAVFYVTEKSTTDLKDVLVPVDFSEASARALQTALAMRTKLGKLQITALYVIDVPMAAYKVNRNLKEIIAQLEQSAAKRFKEFLKTYELNEADFQWKTAMNDDFDVSTYIRKVAKEQGADLIIVGAKGHSMFEDVVFGSVTEKLVTYGGRTPVLVVR